MLMKLNYTVITVPWPWATAHDRDIAMIRIMIIPLEDAWPGIPIYTLIPSTYMNIG